MRNRRDGPPESWQLKASLAVGVTLRGTRAPLTAEPPPLTPWGVGPSCRATVQRRGPVVAVGRVLWACISSQWGLRGAPCGPHSSTCRARPGPLTESRSAHPFPPVTFLALLTSESSNPHHVSAPPWEGGPELRPHPVHGLDSGAPSAVAPRGLSINPCPLKASGLPQAWPSVSTGA